MATRYAARAAFPAGKACAWSGDAVASANSIAEAISTDAAANVACDFAQSDDVYAEPSNSPQVNAGITFRNRFIAAQCSPD
jgi:hypothetical protein